MRRRHLIGFLAALAVSAFTCAAPGASGPSIVDPAELVEPVDVVRAGAYRDGGSVSILLVDAEGRQMPFCIDLMMLSDAKRKKVGAPERGQLLIGVHYPGGDNAVRVQKGSPEEHRILDLLRAYLDRKHTPEQRAAVQSIWVLHTSVRPGDLGMNSGQLNRLTLLTQTIMMLEERCEPSN
jgi:hypothetical protein